MKRIVIINPFGIGDVIFSTPLIEILKKEFPNSYIAYICNRRVSALIKTNPYLDKIFLYEKDDYRTCWKESKMKCIRKILSFLNDIKKERFDISIDLSLGYQYSMFAKILGIKKRVGFNYRNRGRYLTHKLDIDGFYGKHVVDYYLDMLKLFGIDTKKHEVKPKIYVDEFCKSECINQFFKNNGISENDPIIGVIPGCGASWGVDAKYRRWDRMNFARLADELLKKYNAKLILLGDKKEEGICKDIEHSVGRGVINCCGKTAIPDLVCILSNCKVVITNDGGPLHMAAALGVKTISIFGPVDEIVYGPYHSDKDHIVISKKDINCRPCYTKFKYTKCDNRKCLDSITVDEVLKAAEDVLERK